jgi:hydroxylamine reductase
MSMFCRQCEQTGGGKACTIAGVCGKDERTAILQDALLHTLKGIAICAEKSGIEPARRKDIDRFVIEALFSTITNVDFDPEVLKGMVLKGHKIKEKLKTGLEFTGKTADIVGWAPKEDLEGLIEQARKVGVMADPALNEDIRSLREILLYGLKGMAAYADHAVILGNEDEVVNKFFYKALSAITDDALDASALIGIIMEFGQANLKCLEILDKAHTKYFGSPVPTKVSLSTKEGPAIIVSGHDLLDLEQLLKQTEGEGINIYTHGEMLPAHGYPGLKKYPHLVGHFGGAWQDQQKEFDNIPAAILLTTNCIQKPRDSYKNRIFTTGLVRWPGVEHIEGKGAGKDFSKIINKALALKGFEQEVAGKDILIGFGHNAVLGVADKVISAVKQGKIRHFFLIGGCDGAKPGRNYYTEFAQKVPKDCVILTLACGKFRFNKLEFGDIDGIPRLLDCGQCNDAYSAIKIATALAGAFGCSVNDLPLSFILSWYEQKAVCILLTLLSLGINNIKLGPTLPAFVSPNVLKVLVEKFNIAPITTADNDINEILRKKEVGA